MNFDVKNKKKMSHGVRLAAILFLLIEKSVKIYTEEYSYAMNKTA